METGLKEVTMRMNSWPWSQPIQNIATMRFEITNIKQTLRRDMEGREIICNVQSMGPPTVFSFDVPINILIVSEITSQNHILDHLMLNLNGELDLCNFMLPNIYSYARGLAGSRNNGFVVSVDAEVLWSDRTEEITETTMDLASWLLISAMNPDYEYQNHSQDQQLQDQEQEDGDSEHEIDLDESLRMSVTHYEYQDEDQDGDQEDGDSLRGMDLDEWLSMSVMHNENEEQKDEEDSEGVMEKLRRERRFERTDGSEVGNCAICLDDMSASKDLIDMPCRHIFHDACVFRWLKNHNSCPMCRRPVH